MNSLQRICEGADEYFCLKLRILLSLPNKLSALEVLRNRALQIDIYLLTYTDHSLQWRRQLWGTGACAPLAFQQFHF